MHRHNIALALHPGLAGDTRVNYGIEYDYTPAAIVRQVLLLPVV